MIGPTTLNLMNKYLETSVGVAVTTEAAVHVAEGWTTVYSPAVEMQACYASWTRQYSSGQADHVIDVPKLHSRSAFQQQE